MGSSDWSSDVCSSDLRVRRCRGAPSAASAAIRSATATAVDTPRARRLSMQERTWARRFAGEAVAPECAPAQLRETGGAPGSGYSSLSSADFSPANGLSWRIVQIGRASCGERVCQYGYITVVSVTLKKKTA